MAIGPDSKPVAAAGTRVRGAVKGVRSRAGQTVDKIEAAYAAGQRHFGENIVQEGLDKIFIEADDVKCSHGATVGELDAEAKFYLMSRGLDKTQAERLVVGVGVERLGASEHR